MKREWKVSEGKVVLMSGREVPMLPMRVLGLCVHACVRVQSCLTLCDPLDCSPPSSSVCEIFQTGILE